MNLTHVFANPGSTAVELAALAVLVLVQTTFVLGIGHAVAWLVRRRGAAVESAWQRIVLSAALVAPLASALIGLAVVRVRIPVPVFDQAAPLASADAPPQAPLGTPAVHPPGARLVNDAERPETSLLQRPEDRSPPPATGLVHTPESALETPIVSPIATRQFWMRAAAITFCMTWLCVTAALVARLAHSLVGARRLISAAIDAESELIERCRELAEQIGVLCPSVKRSPFVPGPCVFGWRRPVILLRESDGPIDDDVLIHELAHIARRDCFWKTLSDTAAALMWFQPLLWNLKSGMQFCAEEVCDDFVIQFGSDRCAYADRLTRIAEELAERTRKFEIEPIGIGIVSFRSSLGRRVCRILDSRRHLTIRAGRTIIAGLCCGAAAIVFAVGLFGIDRQPGRVSGAQGSANEVAAKSPSPTRNESTRSAAPSQNARLPAKTVSGDVVTVRGVVTASNGQPVAAAKVSAVHSAYVNLVWTRRPIASVNTDARGRFELVYRKSQYGKKAGAPDDWDQISIVVEADGYGTEWNDFMRIYATKPLVFSLAPDFPVHGRVLDLQGQPVANVAVSVLYINKWVEGNLDSWLNELKRGATRQTPTAGVQRTQTPPRDPASPWAMTDPDGRFVIRGIRGERHVTLTVRGESIACDRLSVVTRNMPTLKRERTNFEFQIERLYGADFTYLASPGRPIEGTVRDAATGKPLAGVRVQAWGFTAPHTRVQLDLVGLTDEKGHYRLASLPFGKGNGLFLTPNDELPYLMREVGVPDWRESGPSTFDVGLHRGLWITGRATDKVTGKPVVARLYYFPYLTNLFAKKLPEFHDGNMDGEDGRYWTRADGSFRLVGLPGRAIVGAWASGQTHYRPGVGAAEIGGMDKDGRFPTYTNPIYAGRSWPDSMKEINPREGVDEIKCDLVLDPGTTIQVSLVNQTGKPVEGATVHGAMPGSRGYSEPARFEVVGLTPGDKRPVLIYHEKLRIGKFFFLEYPDKTQSSMTITLEPCAIVKGRVVDRDGIGVKASVSGVPRPGGDFWPRTEPIETQPDGKFECAVPAGCHYALAVDVGRRPASWVENVSVEAGKTIDVGDIKVRGTK